MKTQAQLTLLDSPGNQNDRAEILLWDGRLDNRDDLLWRLKDSRRSEMSNAGLALAVYERWGTSGLVRLIGDWSLVIRDRANCGIVLASDFAGVRPLYYNLQPGRVLGRAVYNLSLKRRKSMSLTSSTSADSWFSADARTIPHIKVSTRFLQVMRSACRLRGRAFAGSGRCRPAM